jgi:hypothetical protein
MKRVTSVSFSILFNARNSRNLSHLGALDKDRVWNKIQGWIEQTLSERGKEVSIKSIALAISTYTMECFRLPRGLCKPIKSLIQNFLVGKCDRTP